MFWMLYAFFWVIHRCLNFICQRFGTLCLFHLHMRVGMKMGQGVPKRRHKKFKRRGITQKAYKPLIHFLKKFRTPPHQGNTMSNIMTLVALAIWVPQVTGCPTSGRLLPFTPQIWSPPPLTSFSLLSAFPLHTPPKPQPHYSHCLSTAITISVLSYIPGLNTVDWIAYIFPCSLHFLGLPWSQTQIFATLVPTYHLQGVLSHKMKIF